MAMRGIVRVGLEEPLKNFIPAIAAAPCAALAGLGVHREAFAPVQSCAKRRAARNLDTLIDLYFFGKIIG